LGRRLEGIERLFHLGNRRCPSGLRLGRARLLHCFLRLFERLRLRIRHDLHVIDVLARRTVPLEAPRGIDHLFLQIRQLARLVTTLLFLLLARRILGFHARAFTKDFIKGPHFREKQIAARAPHLAIRPDIVRPRVPRNKVVGLRADVFEFQEVIKRPFFLRRRARPQFDKLRFGPGHRVRDPVGRRAEIVEHGALKPNFLERRRPHVAPRRSEAQLRHPVRLHIDHEGRGDLVHASV